MKKIICIALSCCMLSSLTQAVFADNYEDEAINYLVENEIVVGDEFGNAMESDPILREQMVSIIGRIGNFSQSRTEGLEEYFTDAGDVSDWAYSYVLEGFEAAYIDGYPDGTFKPQQGMTYEEAIKFTLCAFMQMAETDSAEYIKANYIYPDDYIQLAQDNGYLQDIEVVKGEWMPRGEVFKLLYSVIQNPYPVSDSEEPDINSEREYAWNNSSDFSDEDKDTIEEILDNNVITLDNNNNMNVDEEVSVDDINISLANFVGGVNKDYDLNLPAENLKVNSTDVDDIGTVVNNYINSFDSEEETNVIAKGKMVKYLSDPKWNEVLIYQFIDSWKSAHPGEYVTKGFLIALYKNLYKRIHNWTESYTETLNGAGNYLDGAAYYDGVSYYYNSPYSYEQKSDKPNQFYTVTRKGFYKETKGKAQFMAEGGANFFTYGNYVYYTSGSHLYRIKKNGQNNEKLCDNLSISWGVAKICVDENKLYYKQNDELYSINLADIHSERTFNENSQKVFNDYNTDILVKDGWIYYGLTRRNIKTKDEEIIHTASESSPLLDMNVVDENIYLGRQGIASSYIEKINIENGKQILVDNNIERNTFKFGLGERTSLRHVNVYNGYVYYVRTEGSIVSTNQDPATKIYKMDYNGQDNQVLAEIKGWLSAYKMSISGDYIFLSNQSGTAASRYKYYRININTGEVTESFLPAGTEIYRLEKTEKKVTPTPIPTIAPIPTEKPVETITVGDVPLKDISVDLGYDTVNFSAADYSQMLDIDFDNDGVPEKLVSYNNDYAGAFVIFALQNGEYKEIGVFGDSMTYTVENNSDGYYIKRIGRTSTGSIDTILKLENGSFIEKTSFNRELNKDSQPYVTTYYIDGNTVTEEEYNQTSSLYDNTVIASTNLASNPIG